MIVVVAVVVDQRQLDCEDELDLFQHHLVDLWVLVRLLLVVLLLGFVECELEWRQWHDCHCSQPLFWKSRFDLGERKRDGEQVLMMVALYKSPSQIGVAVMMMISSLKRG